MDNLSDSESFILIDSINFITSKKPKNTLIISNAQLTHSIISKQDNASNSGWSEISAPSNNTNNTNGSRPHNGFSYAGKEKGYQFIDTLNTNKSNKASFPHNNNNDNDERNMISPSNSNANLNHNEFLNNNIANLSIGSSSSRVPFSWAEITKIQPLFHNNDDIEFEAYSPKVFTKNPRVQTLNILTTNEDKKKDIDINKNPTRIQIENNDIHEPLSRIPECDPNATKSDLGRKLNKKAIKRGGRLKYSNGRKGSKRSGRKRNQR